MRAFQAFVLAAFAAFNYLAAGQTCFTPPSGLVGWWRGEGNAVDATSGLEGTLGGNINFVAGQVGEGFNFDGVDDFVRVPASTNLNLGTQNGFTLEAWINPSSVVGAHPILEWNDDNASLPGLIFWLGHINATAGYLHADLFDGSSDHIIESPSGTISANTMQHVVLTYDKSSGIARLFVNGIQVKQQSLGTVSVRNTGNLYIGARLGTAQPVSFQGVIDEPSIYKRALDSNEIQAIYTAGVAGKCIQPPLPPSFYTQPASQSVVVGDPAVFTVSASNALFYQWLFNGDALADQTNATLVLASVQIGDAGSYSVVTSNLNFAITSTNAELTVAVPSCAKAPTGLIAWWPGEGNLIDVAGDNTAELANGADYVAAKVGTGFQLDGVDDYVRVLASPYLNLGAQSGFTLEAWINPSDLAGGHPIFEWNNDEASSPGLIFWLGHIGTSTGYLHADLFDGSMDHVIESAPGTITTNTLQHIALTYEKISGTAQLYVNGILVKQQFLGAVTVQNGGNLYIGARLGSSQPRFFRGIIDEPSIYNRALDPNEIATIYAARSEGKCPIFRITRFTLDPGQVHLKIHGLAGSTNFIERSSDLRNWIHVGVATNIGNDTYEFNDTQTSGEPARFYRARYLR